MDAARMHALGRYFEQSGEGVHAALTAISACYSG
jgi:hypothetical protein